MIRKPPNSPYSSVRLANTCMLAEMLTMELDDKSLWKTGRGRRTLAGSLAVGVGKERKITQRLRQPAKITPRAISSHRLTVLSNWSDVESMKGKLSTNSHTANFSASA